MAPTLISKEEQRLVAERREVMEKQIQAVTSRLYDLDIKLPDTPSFLGKELAYPQVKKRLFGRLKRPYNLSKVRESVIKKQSATDIGATRQKIQELLNKYPNCPDLRVLNGIQIYSDVAQSGLVEKKLDVMGEALKEIGKALHNGSFSLFNITWLVKVYVHYLDLLRSRIVHELTSAQNETHWKIQKAVKQLQYDQFKLETLIAVRDKLGGLSMLNKKFKGSEYVTDCLSKKEIEYACLASQKDLSMTVGTHKIAGYVLLIVITACLLLSRIPLMEGLVNKTLKMMPDISRDLVLQKTMIGTMVLVTRYQLSVAAGEKEVSQATANQIYKRSINAISTHIRGNTLSDPHEVDPFLKAAWIAKESKNLLDKTELESRLRRTLQLLKVVMRNPKEVQASVQLAMQLRNEIQLVMSDFGWSYN
ncbi:hypothetical protein KKI24_00195 [bacterium]|nr:hypothetical protein [bacterium]